MERPLVSVIVNVFNGEKYLVECLESILALEGDFPLQVVITDDASTDGSADILEHYKDSMFSVVRFEKNVGAAAAISHASTLVRGDYIARIDYDDRYRPDFLRQSLPMLSENPEAAFVCASALMIDSESNPSEVVGPAAYGEGPGVADRFVSMLSRHFVTAPTILARTAHWQRAMPIPTGMDFCDWYINLSMAELAPVVVLDAVTADYRIHSLNMHTTKVLSGMGERVTFQVLERFIENSHRGDELKKLAKRIRAWHFADWGDKYFAANMENDCLRCYRAAVVRDPTLLFSSSLARRAAGVAMGRTAYERIKRLASSRER